MATENTKVSAKNTENARIAFRHYFLLVTFYGVLISAQIFAFRGEIAERAQSAVLAYVAGMFIWTFVEYLMHRFSFHRKVTKGLWNYLTSAIHRDHHGAPLEPHILVTPFRLNLPVYIALVILFYFITGRSSGLGTMMGVGLMTGFFFFETIHILIHHTQLEAKSAIFRRFSQYHLNHHYTDSKRAFGVTTRLWDFVFGTLPVHRNSR